MLAVVALHACCQAGQSGAGKRGSDSIRLLGDEHYASFESRNVPPLRIQRVLLASSPRRRQNSKFLVVNLAPTRSDVLKSILYPPVTFKFRS